MRRDTRIGASFIANADEPTIHPLWELAYQKWPNPVYIPIISQRRPYGDDGHSALRWTTLTNGTPLN